MNRVGIIQSAYIPWRGYFDFISDVDQFVVFDDVQYIKRSWINRNQIKTKNGLKWLTIPVHFDQLEPKSIDETLTKNDLNWAEGHLAQIEHTYRKAPHFRAYFSDLSNLLLIDYKNISQLNVALLRWILDILGIDTPLKLARDFPVTGKKTDRLLALVQKLGGTCYLSGPSAESYMETDKFRSAGIGIEYKSYDYDPYPQLYGGFEGHVTILDLLFNCGTNSLSYIKSKTPNRRIV